MEKLMKHAIDCEYGVNHVILHTSGRDTWIEVGVTWPDDGHKTVRTVRIEEPEDVETIVSVAHEDFDLGEVPFGISVQQGIINCDAIQDQLYQDTH